MPFDVVLSMIKSEIGEVPQRLLLAKCLELSGGSDIGIDPVSRLAGGDIGQWQRQEIRNHGFCWFDGPTNYAETKGDAESGSRGFHGVV
jgi:hypothetical protein